MSRLFLRLSVLSILLAAVLSATLEREPREPNIGKFFGNIGKGIKNAATTVGKGIKGAAVAVGKGTKNAAVAVGKGTKNAAVAVGKGTKNAAVAVGKGVKNAATSFGNGFVDAAVTIGTGMKDAYVDIGLDIADKAKSAAEGFNKVITKPLGKVFQRVAVPWIFPLALFNVGSTVYEEAELVWMRTDDSIHHGNNLVEEGQRLMSRADELEKSLGNDVAKRDASGDSKGSRSIIQALRNAAQRAINAGQKIVKNSGKIMEAFTGAVKNISEVIVEGVGDVGIAIKHVSSSISEAGQKLQQSKTSADNVNNGVGKVAHELQRAGDFAMKAGQTFEEVGRRTLSLAEKVFDLGKNLVEVFIKAIKNIAKATGIKGKK